MTLLFAALWWLFLASCACSLAVFGLAVLIHLRDLFGHSEAEQEGRAAVGDGPLSALAAARALGNATGTPGSREDTRRPQDFTVQQPREVSCSSVVVDIESFRGRR